MQYQHPELEIVRAALDQTGTPTDAKGTQRNYLTLRHWLMEERPKETMDALVEFL